MVCFLWRVDALRSEMMDKELIFPELPTTPNPHFTQNSEEMVAWFYNKCVEIGIHHTRCEPYMVEMHEEPNGDHKITWGIRLRTLPVSEDSGSTHQESPCT